MPFSDIRGQDQAISVLKRMVAQKRVPGALLFLGPGHVGKATAAIALAQALNCEAPVGVNTAGPDACGTCASCRKIGSSTHPDVEIVEPEGQFIKIDQIREVSNRLSLNPLLAQRRMVVFKSAEQMNPQAANAFLKTLEEPPADTTLVLCATGRSALPETIVSRCVPVRFLPLTDGILKSLFKAHLEAAAPKRGRAKADAPSLEGPALEFAVRFAQGSLKPELKTQAAAWHALREELLAALHELPAGGDLAGDRLARFSAKEDMDFVLEWLETWWRDVAVLVAGGSQEALINVDKQDSAGQWARRAAADEIMKCHRHVLATRSALEVHVNGALAMEGLWLGFKHVLSEGAAVRRSA